MNNFLKIEEQSFLLTKTIGNIKIQDNLILKDLFIYKNINLWQVYEPIIAIYLIPQIISKKRNRFYKKLNLLKNLLKIFSSIFKKNKVVDKNNYWLFVCFSDYMFNDTMSPLIESLNNNKNFEYLLSNKIYKRDTIIKNISHLLLFIKQIENKIKSCNFNNLILDNIQVTKSDLLYIINYLIYNLIPRSYIDIETAFTLFEKNKPKVVISIDIANPSNRIYTLLAKKHAVLSIDLQYGHYESTDIEWRYSISDKIFVWGENYASLFINHHFIDRNKILITGSPKFDYIINRKFISDNKNQSLKIKILFASTYTISSYDNIEKYEVIKKFKTDLINAIIKFKNIELIIKPHPLENIKWLKNISLSSNIIILPQIANIKNLINECNYFISFGSTSTFDALLQNKICFSVNYQNTKKNLDVFVKNEIVNNINNNHELLEILNKISNNSFTEPFNISKNRNNFLKSAVLHFDNLIEEKISNSSCLINSTINSFLELKK